jgi:uncharacterized protein YndB with AHSA1/START domain
MQLNQSPVARAGMLIRRPVHEVYEAFVDPEITRNFWFTKGSDRLDSGRPVTWTWEMYGISSEVRATEIVKDRKIVATWGAGADASIIEWNFTHRAEGTTFVDVSNSGFQGDGDGQAAQAIGSTDGFAIVLCGLKAWLEHGIRLDAIGDRWPDGVG